MSKIDVMKLEVNSPWKRGDAVESGNCKSQNVHFTGRFADNLHMFSISTSHASNYNVVCQVSFGGDIKYPQDQRLSSMSS